MPLDGEARGEHDDGEPGSAAALSRSKSMASVLRRLIVDVLF